MPKTDTVSVWAGTRKGAFVFRSSNRKTWRIEGPFFRGWEVHHVAQDPREPARHYAAINSAWFGAHIHTSTDGGKNWKLSEAGLEIKCLPETSLKRVWHVEPGAADEPGAVYAGGDPGVVFKREDWGQNWEEVALLPAHPTREKRAAGAFRTVAGGASWQPFNAGVRADFQPVKFPERFLATLGLGGYLGGAFLSDLVDKGVEVIHRFKLNALAAVELIESFLGGGAEPFDLGLVFLLALLQQPEAFAHHFAGIAEAAGGDARLDKAVEMFGEIDVAGWQVKVLL